MTITINKDMVGNEWIAADERGANSMDLFSIQLSIPKENLHT